jgi:hypothetical protein
MHVVLLGGSGRFARAIRLRFGGGCAGVELRVQAHPKYVVLIELARCVALSGAIKEKLIDAPEIDIEIFCPREPMIGQGKFEAGQFACAVG